MTSNISHVIFDVDGTLIEEADRLKVQALAVAWKFGENVSEMQRTIDTFFAVNDEVKDNKECKGDIAWYMLRMGEHLRIEVSDAEAVTLAEAWSNAYSDSHKEPALFPDVIECLDALKAKKVTLIVASGNTVESRKQLLQNTGILEYFDTIFAATDVGFQKQDVRFWHALLDTIAVAPEHIAVVGNQINDDIMHPKSLGMTTVFVDRPGVLRKNIGPKDVEAQYVIDDLKQLTNVITT
ncbi:MAG: FMN phosphatase YigB (HAD superfamily) [Candidatus Azotimanducaceae bacterium]|jgi:FMN phosphatase YigB (HAD superfamily)